MHLLLLHESSRPNAKLSCSQLLSSVHVPYPPKRIVGLSGFGWRTWNNLKQPHASLLYSLSLCICIYHYVTYIYIYTTPVEWRIRWMTMIRFIPSQNKLMNRATRQFTGSQRLTDLRQYLEVLGPWQQRKRQPLADDSPDGMLLGRPSEHVWGCSSWLTDWTRQWHRHITVSPVTF